MQALTFCFTCFQILPLQKANLQTLATFGKMLFEPRNDCWLPSISSFLATIPRSLLDICGRPQGHLELCLHTTCAGAASSFSQELPGMGTDTLQHLTGRCWKAAATVMGPHLILGTSKLWLQDSLLMEIFRSGVVFLSGCNRQK